MFKGREGAGGERKSPRSYGCENDPINPPPPRHRLPPRVVFAGDSVMAKKVKTVIKVPEGPAVCAKCGKIEANHFFKTRHCAPHRDDVYEAAK